VRSKRKSWVYYRRAALFAVLACLAFAQDDIPGKKIPSVTMSAPELISIARGKPGTVILHFRVERGFHVNSNKPKSEFLIPTALKINPPTDIIIGKVTYPEGEDKSFPFSPDEKLNVYTGDFSVDVVVRPLATVVAGKYALHGELKYQACDNAACYPPKKIPVDFQVKVVKGAAPSRRNPRQSPHIHS
jgi:Disulphide bond corrector protein DsbC